MVAGCAAGPEEVAGMDHMRESISAVGCRGACELKGQGREEARWRLRRDSNTLLPVPPSLGQHTRSPVACWEHSSLGYLKEITIAHIPGGLASGDTCANWDAFSVTPTGAVREPPRMTAQTTRWGVCATLRFTKKEEAASHNNFVGWKPVRRCRIEDIFHRSEEVPLLMHLAEMKKELKVQNEDGHVQRWCD